MSRSLKKGLRDERGFTLIETLVALALMGLVLSALANITSQWLPNWNRGMERIQRSEAVGIALQRIAADVAAAENVPANREQRRPLFDGSELTMMFVRTALGPNAKPGLEVVRIGETTDLRDVVTARSRAPFAPLQPAASFSEQIQFGDSVVLLRTPFRLSFSYAGRDRIWKNNWHEADQLPSMIMLTVRDAATERVLSMSTIASVHASAREGESCARPGSGCDGKPDDLERNPGDRPRSATAVSGRGGS